MFTLPLYRQERIFRRAGVEIPRSALAEWVGACGNAVAEAGLVAGIIITEQLVLPVTGPEVVSFYSPFQNRVSSRTVFLARKPVS
tara:strand:+ start:345 stop:599 length:255 start_codon:yes stop_codon:yes gene_type:complete